MSYNGVVLPYAASTRFNQEAAYDDSVTDRVYTKFDIEVTCVLHANYLSLLAPGLTTPVGNTTDNPAEILDFIRGRLMQPRRALTYSVSGVNLIPVVNSNAGTVDARNGPQPQSCNIVQLTNSSFLLSYRIIAHYVENVAVSPTGSPAFTNQVALNFQQGNDVVSHRWSETAELDEDNFSTRVREGKVIIRSDNKDGFKADRFRGLMANLSVPSGFLRKSSRYVVDPSGLGLAYRVEDREVFKKPPAPAFRAEGTYAESCTENAAMKFGEVRVKLFGGKGTNQNTLIEEAVALGMGKIRRATGEGEDHQIQHGVVRIGLFDNSVEFLANFLLPPTRARLNGLLLGDIDTRTGVSSSYLPPYRCRGSANLLLQAAAYYDPTLADLKLGTGTGRLVSAADLTQGGDTQLQLSKGQEVGSAGKTKEP